MKSFDYTFENFVATTYNRFACLAAEKVCEAPGVYNPLYIFGPSGVGKTYLLRAIEKEYQNKKKTALYISVNRFCEELVKAIRNGTNIEFREKYNQVDVLLVDRFEYFAGKEATQEEFFNIVQNRYQNSKQTVIVGTVYPSELPGVYPALSSFFCNGLCVKIPTPNFEEVAQIIYKKLHEHGRNWPMDACRYIAINISRGCVAGEINQILAFSELFPNTP